MLKISTQGNMRVYGQYAAGASHFNITLLTYRSVIYSIPFVNSKDFFLNPSSASQRHYEALRLFYVDGLPADRAASQLGLSPAYFNDYRLKAKECCGRKCPFRLKPSEAIRIFRLKAKLYTLPPGNHTPLMVGNRYLFVLGTSS